MARRESGEINELKIYDNLSDSEITLYYRMPTTRERQDYQNKSMQRKGNKVEFNQAAARLESGMTILVGFKEGGFERKVEEKYVPFTWKEGSENYYPEWKTWLMKNAADLIMLLAAQVFDVSAIIAKGEEGKEEESIEGK